MSIGATSWAKKTEPGGLALVFREAGDNIPRLMDVPSGQLAWWLRSPGRPGLLSHHASCPAGTSINRGMLSPASRNTRASPPGSVFFAQLVAPIDITLAKVTSA